MLVTYWSVDFTLLFEQPYFFRRQIQLSDFFQCIFGKQKFSREFGYQWWLRVYILPI